MFKAWRRRRLEVKLASVEARVEGLRHVVEGNDEVYAGFINRYIAAREEAAKINKRLEQLQ